MYPEEVLTAGDGSPVNAAGEINAASWDAYEATVMVGPNETAAQSREWGDAINGARGAAMNVLEQVYMGIWGMGRFRMIPHEGELRELSFCSPENLSQQK